MVDQVEGRRGVDGVWSGQVHDPELAHVHCTAVDRISTESESRGPSATAQLLVSDVELGH